MKIANLLFASGGTAGDQGKEQPWIGVAKFLLLNVGGKVAGILATTIGLVWLFAPELHGAWADRAWRLLQSCVIWLVACIFWQQKRNSRALITTLAQKQIADPALGNSSPDPAVQREVQKQLAEKNGALAQAPTMGPSDL